MVILMISIIICLIIVVLAVQNSAIVPIQFFVWSTELPLVLVIFCSVFTGALLMFLLALFRNVKHRIGFGVKRNHLISNKGPIEIAEPSKEEYAAATGGEELNEQVNQQDK